RVDRRIGSVRKAKRRRIVGSQWVLSGWRFADNHVDGAARHVERRKTVSADKEIARVPRFISKDLDQPSTHIHRAEAAGVQTDGEVVTALVVATLHVEGAETI